MIPALVAGALRLFQQETKGVGANLVGGGFRG